jgi:signal transduction histidine kinase/CheY-like chemotaxis protein
VFSLAGVSVAVPAASGMITPLSRGLAVLSALAYYLGFAPPGWIAEAWRGLRLGGQVVPLVVVATVLTATGTAAVVTYQLLEAWREQLQRHAVLATPPASDLYGPLTEATLHSAGFAAVLILVLTAASAVLAERLFRPMRGLTAAAARLGRGEYGARAPVAGAADLRELAAQFNRMAEAVEARDAALREQRGQVETQNAALAAASRHKSEFLANMSHELRTPLNAINGFSQLLLVAGEQEYDRETRRTYLRTIHESGQHLLQLINDILDLSKVEAGRMELRPVEIDVPALVGRVLATVQPLAERKRLLLSSDPDTGTAGQGQDGAAGMDLEIEADEGKLKQILYNLVSNAIKFTPDGGAVAVVIRTASDSDEPGVQITVADTGIGIAAENQGRIFEEFQQIEMGADRRYEGTGLGLALTKRLVELHGGRIWVESQLGEGSQFHVLLPRRQEAGRTETRPGGASAGIDGVDGRIAGMDDATAAAVPPAMPAEVPPRDGPLVLVVEDDPWSARLLTAYLYRGGYRTMVVSDGQEALRQAPLKAPAAITLDVLLPELDGWEVLRALKTGEATRDIPVVIVSVVDDEQLGYALGASDYLVKPVEVGRLLACLERHINGHQHGRGGDQVVPRERSVLVVDDDPAAVTLLGGMLRPAGYTVLSAGGGADGIRQAREHRPDLLLLDLMMPEVSGFDVVTALKSDASTHEIPIVVVTAKDLTAEDKRQLNGQVASVLTKGSLVADDLLRWLDKLTHRGNGASGARAASAAADAASAVRVVVP